MFTPVGSHVGFKSTGYIAWDKYERAGSSLGEGESEEELP